MVNALSDPFYSGSATSALVPGLYPAALAGRPYMLDLKSKDFRRRTIPQLRPQADTGTQFTEGSLSPEDLTRSAQESWHRGAGQTYADRPESDPNRFRTSKGVDVWTKWRMGLLPATDRKRSSAATNLFLAVAGARVYVTDGAELRFATSLSADSPTFTNVTGVPATSPTSITSDGFNVYTAHGADGIYRSTTSVTTTASYITGDITLVGWVKDRLMASYANEVYNITTALPGPAAKPTALWTHRSTGWTTVGFAEGHSHGYFAGFSGDKSTIYKFAVKADGSALDAPVVAGNLPDGEIVRSIKGYLGGFIMIGSDLGFRLAAIDSAGNLQVGPLVETTSAVRCFEPQGRFFWYGLTNFDGTSTGLGRLDITQFTDTLTPAFASDLMATAQGSVLDVVTFGDRRVFTVSGAGVWAEDTVKVAEGTLDTGLMTLGIPDTKVAMYLDLRHHALMGQVTVYQSVDNAGFVLAGISAQPLSTTPPERISLNASRGETFEIRLALARMATDTTAGPEVTRLTLLAEPAPVRGDVWFLPLILHERMDVNGSDQYMDPLIEQQRLLATIADGLPVMLQLGSLTQSVFVKDAEWIPNHEDAADTFWHGVLLVKAKSA